MAIVTAIAILIRDELLPTLEARPAFQARVAANALEIVARELTHAPRVNAEEAARLEKLLGKPGDLAALKRPLFRCIAAGARNETAAAAARIE
jgi:hypothetical protein